MLTIVAGTKFDERYLVMKILEAGGIKIVNEGQNLFDIEDLYVLKEYEKIQLIQERPAEIFIEENICLNLTSFLLKQLPTNYFYNVLLIEKNNQEYDCQNDNVYYNVFIKNNIVDLMKKRFIEEHIRYCKSWLRSKSNFNVVSFNFDAMINNPIEVLNKLNSSLNLNLNVEKSLDAIFPKIHSKFQKRVF